MTDVVPPPSIGTAPTSPPLSAPRPLPSDAPEWVRLATIPAAAVLEALGTRATGLTGAEVAERRTRYGPNRVAAAGERGRLGRISRALANPLIALLAVIAIASLASGDRRAAIVIAIMIVLGVALQLVQEGRASAAAARLQAMVRITASVTRDGVASEIPVHDIVRGDVVHVAAGDMFPADVRVIAARDLFVNQATLTGESAPAEKRDALGDEPAPELPLDAPTLGFLGTSVASGTATAVVIATGRDTQFGAVAHGVAREKGDTAFDRGITRFTWLMIRLIAVMVPLVFVINGVTKHDWREAFFFALAVAVGLTPEMLPMIVSVCLAEGAVAMSRKRVIVKRLDAIQNFGAMDVLCTDKTGTLTRDEVILQRHCDVTGTESERVLTLAALVSHYQSGLRNVLDRAVLTHLGAAAEAALGAYEKIDEVPFDFERKMMSVVVETPSHQRLLLTKGAPESIFPRCTRYECDGEVHPADAARIEELEAEYRALSADGFRVLAVAFRPVEPRARYEPCDEAELTLAGYVAFLDPPKETARAAVAALHRGGVMVRTLTGDNDLVARRVCEQVGIPTDRVVVGADVERMSDEELARTVDVAAVFARVTPVHKQRIIGALQARGHVVGFLGDGVNDAPALRAADVGISVDSAVDVAKAAADIVLLDKSLLILEEGVREGRKVFSNVVKYLRMGASSNFGNMLSVIGASAWLPFVPMAPIQVLTNNLLYDVSQVPIPTAWTWNRPPGRGRGRFRSCAASSC